jgi:AcrR family transcriptional regulator
MAERRLPRGRHGLPRKLVAENQRARLIGGIVEAVAAQGYVKATVGDVIGLAGVSRQTFYESFADKTACFLAAHAACFQFLREQMTSAPAGDDWTASARARLRTLLECLSAHPDLASFFLISPNAAGTAIAKQHHEAMRELVETVTEGAPQQGMSAKVHSRAFAGGLSRLATMKIERGEVEQLPSLLSPLLELLLRPYLGSERATRIARA